MAARKAGSHLNLLDAATTEANIGEVLVNQGRLDEAEPMLRDAARVLRSSGYAWAATFAEMQASVVVKAGVLLAALRQFGGAELATPMLELVALLPLTP